MAISDLHKVALSIQVQVKVVTSSAKGTRGVSESVALTRNQKHEGLVTNFFQCGQLSENGT